MTSFYRQWLDSLEVEAPKVFIQCLGDGQRGLFASSDIFSGERILYLPEKTLLSSELLQKHGSLLLETAHDHTLSEEHKIVAMIEEIRQLLSIGHLNMVQLTAQTLQYQWRDDDAVALYLIACRKLQRRLQEHSDGEPTNSIIGADERIQESQESIHFEASRLTFETSEPILVHAVVPLADEADLVLVEPSSAELADLNPAAESSVTESISSFLPHVTLLPTSYPTNPLSYAEDELTRIEGTNCCEFAKRMLTQMESDWIQLSAVLRCYLVMDDRKIQCTNDDNELQDFLWEPDQDFELYKWALMTIYSRSTDFNSNQNKHHRRVIAPVFDMMNHDFNSKVTHEMDPDGSLSVFAGSDIAAGAEIFLNYGNFPNEKLLLVYGFVVNPNPFDAVQIYAPIPITDPLYASKAYILKSKCGILDPNAPHLLRSNKPIPESLLSSLRLTGIQSENELTRIVSSNETIVDMVCQENEYNALMALTHALHTMARRLALNMISDENIHAASGLHLQADDALMTRTLLSPIVDSSLEPTHQAKRTNLNIKNCKILCQSEYMVLQNALAELSARLELLEHATDEGCISQCD